SGLPAVAARPPPRATATAPRCGCAREQVRARRAGHAAARPLPDSAHPPARAHRALTSGRCSSRTCVNMITHTVARPGLGCRLAARAAAECEHDEFLPGGA